MNISSYSFIYLLVLMGACMICLASSGPLLGLFKSFLLIGRRSRRYDAVYNLGLPGRRAGHSKFDPGVTLEEDFEGTRFGCSRRGVFKITLSNSTVDTSRSRVLIDLVLRNPLDFVFNIGDSRTNNGEGDDADTQAHDAQVVGINRSFQVFLSDASGGGKPVDLLDVYRSHVTIAIGDGELIWSADGSRHFNYVISPGLFALGSQEDAEGDMNLDIFLGVNRAIARGTTNIGSGVCGVGIRFLPIMN